MTHLQAVKFHEYQPGNEDFRHYIDRLNYCFIANNIVTDEARKANFFTVCGSQVYELVAALITPLQTYEVRYETIIEILAKHYTPKANEITMTYRFYSPYQRDGEKASDYNTELRKIGACCNFDNLERNLRDRLVCGMRDEKLKFDLLKRNKLNYHEVLEEMIAAEMAHQDITLMQTAGASFEIVNNHNKSSGEAMDIGAVNEQVSKFKYRLCYRCGDKHSGVCRFVNTICNYCNKKGHIEKVCTMKRRQGNSKKINYTTEVDNSGEFLNGIYCLSEEKCSYQRKTPPFEVEVLLCGISVTMQVDSGASYSLINKDTFNRLPVSQTNKLQPLAIQLSTWTDTPVKLLGQLNIQVQYKDYNKCLSVIVARGSGPNLLGRDWFLPLNIFLNNINTVAECESYQNLLTKYKDVFNSSLGMYRGEPVSIKLSPDAIPKFLKARYALKERVEKEIDNMVANGVLKPIPYSQWATPVVPIIKKNGSIRLCGDYRSTINQATESDTYPMPTASEIFALLAGGKYFTTLDLDRAYTQVTVDEETAKLLTLNTCKGLFSVHRLAFGVKASPGIFQRIMSSLLANIPGVAVLLDDIIITGRSREEMYDRLDIVLNRIAKAGLRLNKDKCRFARSSVEFLGFIVDAEGIRPAASKVEAIVSTQVPKNVQQLQAFLGLYNFYERFIPHKATLLEPLHRLLDKKTSWKWTETEQRAFDRAKNQITCDITLTHYDVNKQLILTCDSSEYGVGVVLSHVLENGIEKPIAMGSRTLHPHERRYSQIDKEATAIMFGIKKFNNYLMGREFTIITDHQPLLGIFNPSKKIPDLLSPRLVRYCLALAAHDYKIIYKPGRTIGNADGLSRWPQPIVAHNNYIPGEILLMAETPQELPFDIQEIAKETSKDIVLGRVLHHILRGWPTRMQDKDLHIYWLHRMELSVQDGCVLIGNRVILPPNMRENILKLLHHTHSGMVHTKALARSYVWWPQMDKDIEAMISSCENCLENRKMPVKTAYEWIMSGRPWSRLHLDFAGPFQNQTFLIVVDAFSKWPEIRVVSNMTSATIIKHMRYIFAQHGLCETLVTDNGTPFVSKEFKLFLEANKIRHITTAPHHPATNGQAERMVQTVKSKLRKMHDVPWDIKLPKILLSLRVTPCSATNKSPAELLMNRQLRTLLDAVHPNTGRQRKKELQIERNIQKTHREIDIGRNVMYRNYIGAPKWMPGKIVEKEGPGSYRIETQGGTVVHRHIDQLVKVREKESGSGKEMEHNEGELESQPQTSNLDQDQYDEIIEVPSSEQWADIIGVPTSATSDIGKIKKKPQLHAKVPYGRP